MKKKISIGLVVILLMSFLHMQNNTLETTFYKVETKKDIGAKSLRIVQISDLHGKEFGKDNEKLIKKIEELKPDIIFLTGDLVDSRRYEPQKSYEFCERISKICKIYYVSGNHEERKKAYDYEKIRKMGIFVLDNKLEKYNEQIEIIGIRDPQGVRGKVDNTIRRELKEAFSESRKDNFKILLAHRPHKIHLYLDYSPDLVFSGHAHGGQIRLPLIGGLLTPGQGFLPKYSEGIIQEKNTKLLISRGLGNSIFPQRLFNLPEILVLDINCIEK